MKAGIILLPEDRQKQGLILSWGLGRNVTLPIQDELAKNGFNDEKKERELSKKFLEEVDTKAVTIFQPASSLSGGNQQKVVVAKALAQSNMKVVIMDEPTKGIDVGAKKEIYEIMGQLAKKGYGIIMISSEMPEIIGMADRIFVMCNGRVSGCLQRSRLLRRRILELSMEQSFREGRSSIMKKKSVGQFLSESREASLVIVLIVLLVIVGIINPSFLSFTNIRQIFLNNTLTFLMALGMLCVMLTAGIDISITSTLAFAGMSIGLLQKYNVIHNTFLLFVIGTVIGLVCGFLNGIIIAKGKGGTHHMHHGLHVYMERHGLCDL